MSLIVKPISGMLTKDTDLFGKMDPYVVCKIGNEQKRTKTHSGGGKKPQWMDTLTFMSQGSIMSVSVFDDDFGKDQFIGEGSVNLNQFYSNPSRTQNEYVDLIKNGKSSGRVLLSIQYQGPPMNQGGGNYGNGGGWNQPNQNWGPPQGNNWGPNNGGYGPNNGGWGNGPNNGGWGNGPNNGGWGPNNGPNNGGWGPNNGGWGNGPNNGPNNNGWGPNNAGWGNQGNNNGGWGNGW